MALIGFVLRFDFSVSEVHTYIMERRIDPDSFGLAYALIRCDGSEFCLIDCNEHFEKLSGIRPDDKADVSAAAFGDERKELMRRLSVSHEIILPFLTTGKTLRTRVRKRDDDLLELVGIDYTLFQKKQELFEFRTTGYKQFIENLQGISFQRMIRPETLSTFTSGALEELTGYSEDQAKDLETWLNIIHPDDRERMKEEGMKLYNESGYQKESEYRIIRKDGVIRWVHSYDNHFLSKDGHYEMVQGLIVDVTKQKVQQEQIQEQNVLLEEISMTDHLTSLSNRRFMNRILNLFISDYKRSGESFSLLMMDLDHFKMINDKYGHDGGDAVIVEMAKILIKDLRDTDIKARWGGEEFLVLLPRTEKSEAMVIAGKLLNIVRMRTVTHNKIDMKFTFSCGVAVNDRKLSSEMLLKQADRALYRAKGNGRNQICLWDD